MQQRLIQKYDLNHDGVVDQNEMPPGVARVSSVSTAIAMAGSMAPISRNEKQGRTYFLDQPRNKVAPSFSTSVSMQPRCWLDGADQP